LVQLTFHKDHGGKRSPRPAQKDLPCLSVGGDLAVIKNVAALLLRVAFALRCNVGLRVCDHMDMAAIKDSLGIAKNEVYIALDVAVIEILARRIARAAVARA